MTSHKIYSLKAIRSCIESQDHSGCHHKFCLCLSFVVLKVGSFLCYY